MSIKSLSFDKNAKLYDEMRPGYPEELFIELKKMAKLDDVSRILEVGCGTGQATKELIKISKNIIAIDPGSNMVNVAREHFPSLEFHVSSFENYRASQKFDLIISATAWHWVDPEISYKKAHELLKDNGHLAVLHNYHLDDNPNSFHIRANSIYRKYGLKSKPPKRYSRGPINKMSKLIENQFFHLVTTLELKWSRTLSIDDYIKLRNTYSDHITMDTNKRLQFEKELRDFAYKEFKGKVTKSHIAVLFLAEKK